MARKLTGIRRRHQSWEVNVRVNGHLYTDTFPLTTPVEELRDWREDQVDKFGGVRGKPSLVVLEPAQLPNRQDGQCYVYFVRSRWAVKIGRSLNPAQRIRELQTTHAFDLAVLAAVAAPASLEAALHDRFQHLRTRVHGEWFRLAPELIAFIHALQRGADLARLLEEDPRVVLGWYVHPPPRPTDSPKNIPPCLEN